MTAARRARALRTGTSTLVVALMGGCSRAPMPEPDRAPTATASAGTASASAARAASPPMASASATTTGDASPAAPWRPKPRPELRAKPVSGWTDPRVIDLLEHDCAYTVERDADPTQVRASFELDDAVADPSGVLLCGGIIEQTCYPVPCSAAGCQNECGEKCEACARPCADKCASCKSTCTDDACRRACAEQCGQCHKACNAAADRCVTATCGKRYDACMRDFNAKFKASGCEPQCSRRRTCTGCMNEGRTTGACKGCDKFEVTPRCEPMCQYDMAW